MDFLLDRATWVALLQIIGINIVLSGDNAVVIALACRSLPAKQRKLGVLFGAGGAVVARIILTFVAVWLLEIPFLKIVGALLLIWIGLKLLLPEDGGGDNVSDNDNLIAAVKTILIADVVMSLDNVLGVAAAAKGSMPLIIAGLLISIPIVIFGSQIIMKLMDRFPIIVTIGAGLLGYVAGEMGVTDPALKDRLGESAPFLHIVLPWAGAMFVVVAGTLLARRSESKVKHLVDLAAPERVAQPAAKSDR
jgi:YjbE family integral membrane protein